MLRRISRRARRNHNTPSAPLPSQTAQADLDEVDHSAVIHINDPVLWFLEIAIGVKSISEVVRFLADAGVGDADIDVAGGLEGAEQLRPRGDVGFEEGGVGREGFVGGAEVEDVDCGAVGGEDLDGGETDAVGAA